MDEGRQQEEEGDEPTAPSADGGAVDDGPLDTLGMTAQ